MKRHLLKTTLALASLVTLSAASAATATASNSDPLRLHRMAADERIASPAPIPAPAIRYAKLRAKLQKAFREQQSDGTYKTKIEDVCDIVGKAPVFEIQANESVKIEPNHYLECEANLKLGRAKIGMLHFILIAHGADPFGDHQPADLKSFFSHFYVASPDGTYFRSAPVANAITPDLATRTMLFYGRSENIGTDAPGDRIVEEQFILTAKLED